MAPNVTDSYQQILARAKAGTLTFPEFSLYYTTRVFAVSKDQLVTEVSAILAAVAVTEPNQTWVKQGWVQIKDGGVSVVSQTTEMFPGQGLLSNAGQSASNATEGITSTLDFLKMLTSAQLWTRVAEFAVGGILIVVGANALLRTGMGSNAPQIRPPKTGFTYAKKALP